MFVDSVPLLEVLCVCVCVANDYAVHYCTVTIRSPVSGERVWTVWVNPMNPNFRIVTAKISHLFSIFLFFFTRVLQNCCATWLYRRCRTYLHAMGLAPFYTIRILTGDVGSQTPISRSPSRLRIIIFTVQNTYSAQAPFFRTQCTVLFYFSVTRDVMHSMLFPHTHRAVQKCVIHCVKVLHSYVWEWLLCLWLLVVRLTRHPEFIQL